jgi:hypothetical protein
MIPGGLGARDAALAVLIETLLPQIHAASAAAAGGMALAASPQALVAAVMLRITVLAAEAVCAGVLYPLTFLRPDHAVGRDPRL